MNISTVRQRDKLHIDIETYSPVDLRATGVYPYVNDPNFDILLLAFAFGEGPVELIDLTWSYIPKDLLRDLTNPKLLKCAHNANFERTCLAQKYKQFMDPEQWFCSAVAAMMLGLPRALGDVCNVLKLPKDQAKDREGYQLIQYFCKPCKPTKVNGMRTRNNPSDDPKKWERFGEYCKQDVVAERAIDNRLAKYYYHEPEFKLWVLDQRINDRGVLIDGAMAKAAADIGDAQKQKLIKEAIDLTGMSNPNSTQQLMAWLESNNMALPNTQKKTIAEALKTGLDPTVRRMLQIRQELNKSSLAKYNAMLRGQCPDGRVRGTLQLYGASRTGRWAGRIIQPQNLSKNNMKNLDLARQIVRARDAESLEMLFPSITKTLSELIRTAIVPAPEHTFVVADFSAIEARVLAWLANEKWRMEVFAGNGKIYEASAEQMFHLEPGSVGKHSPERQKGKVAELALGYGGAKGALIAMGAFDYGLKEDELPPLVAAWRAASPHIVQFWWDCGDAAMEAIKTHEPQIVYLKNCQIEFRCDTSAIMEIVLPNGRRLRYLRPRIVQMLRTIKGEQRLVDTITYEGKDDKGWGRQQTYGPKIVENITQAIARDCLAHAMLEVSERWDEIVFDVHDEMILETLIKEAEARLKAVLEIMSRPIPWAPGLLLKGDGYLCDYYKKE